MAIIVITDQHEAVLSKIERAMDAGVIDDWTYGADREFTFTNRRAAKIRLRSTTDGDAIVFGVVPAAGEPLTATTYARVHASFAEILLEFADDVFDSVEIMAQVTEYDYAE